MPIVFGCRFPIPPLHHRRSPFARIIGILPALKAEAFATYPAGPASKRWAIAGASSRLVKPFTRDSGIQAGFGAPNPPLTALRLAIVRSCGTFLSQKVSQDPGAAWELRLIKLQ